MKLNYLLFFLCLLLYISACKGKKTGEGETESTGSEPNTTGTTKSDYSQPHRPRFHFSPPAKWMNDPNGMVYHQGEYHLFYQHNPDSSVWGPMHWGHATSKDLVHWQNQPIALYPDSLGTIFSGSAVYDEQNTSGLGSANNPPLVAIFTSHLTEAEKAGRNNYQTQSLAYSLDNGRTWKKYAKNPVLPNPGIKDFRDPKVSWHSPSKQWVMVLAVVDHIEFYGSPNLLSWKKLSQFGGKGIGAHGGVWECPDLFPLTVNGQEKWVLLVSINPGGPQGGSATQYFVGNFNGKQFTWDQKPGIPLWVDWGADNYAGVTWANAPDGRRIFLGWMSNWEYAKTVPTEVWRTAMTIPRELRLVKTPSDLRLTSTPVKELQKLRTRTEVIKAREITSNLNLSEVNKLNEPLLELDLNLAVPPNQDLVIRFSNSKGEFLDVGYAGKNQHLFIDRTKAGNSGFNQKFAARHEAPLTLETSQLRLHLFLDVASVEVFANNGLGVMTDIFFPSEPFTRVEIIGKGIKVLDGSHAYMLQSIWD